MGGAAEFPDRALSPLKRRAFSMDPEANADANEDVDMIAAPTPAPSAPEQTGVDQTGDQHMQSDGKVPQGLNVEAHIQSISTFCDEFVARQPKDGDKAYIVSRNWVDSVVGNSKEPKGAKSAARNLGSIGPVDNSEIIWEVIHEQGVGSNADPEQKKFVRLKPGTDNAEHFSLFPQAAWDLLMVYPGLKSGQFPIIRTAHNTSDNENDPNVMWEYHPPVFTIHRLWSATSPRPIPQIMKSSRPPPVKLARGRTTTYRAFLAQAKMATDIGLKDKVRVWRIPQKVQAAATLASAAVPTPPASPESTSDPNNSEDPWQYKLVDVVTFTALEKDTERERVDYQDVTATNYNGHATLQLVGLTADQSIVLDEHVEGTKYVSNYSAKQASSTVRSSSASLAVSRNTRSGRNSPAPSSSGPVTRGRTQKPGRQVGCVGLGNLGNTCYMNAALQCVRSVEELTKYFISQEWEKEINKENVLAHNGDVAAAYAHLLHEIYKDPSPSSVTPRHFKGVIGRYAPAFSGWGQQDSQEFLGFLLDGLQEDLSRIKKKPYIEKPDSTDEMIGNPAAIREMAEKVWDITKKRDDSVIADLFTGLYKSTLVCPDPNCAKVSITFDPFNNLTLPLPVENKWSHTIKFFPLKDKPIEMKVELDKSSSIKGLKNFVSQRTGIPVELLHGAEEWKGKFYKQYSNGATASEEIGANDNGWIFELEAPPTNWDTAESKKLENGNKGRVRSMIDEAETQSPNVYNKMLVPVIHRRPSTSTYHKYSFACVPHFIVVDPEEAQSEDIIRRKILQKVATFSRHEIFRREESDASDTTDPEMVGSDFSSSNEDKFIAHSVEGEDDIVDVSMKDAADINTTNQKSESKSRPLKYSFNKTAPAWVDPEKLLPAELQNMFELGFFSEGGSLVPTGMNGVTEDKEYPRLLSRAADPNASDDAHDSATMDGDSDEQSQTSTSARLSSDNSLTRMADESDDEETTQAVKQLPHRPKQARSNAKPNGRGNKKFKPGKKYGKKGNKHLAKQQRKQQQDEQFYEAQVSPEPEPATADGGPLIRLREGIVVDWHLGAYDELFGGLLSTWDPCDIMADPDLERAAKARTQRRKNGIDLSDCLDEFEREEVLSDQDTWYCPRCKQHQRATKKFDLWKTPDILVVHLKRFSSSGYRRDKLEVLVNFPIEGLDLTRRVLNKEDGKEEVYDLIGVDCHWGGLGGGHYTAYAKNFVDHQWYSYNDSMVNKTCPEKIVDTGAYLLFYRRRSEHALGGPRFQEILDSYHVTSDEDNSDAGEGQCLGEGFSQTGSPSAFQGQGASLTHPRQIAGRGGNGTMGSAATRTGETQSDDGLVQHIDRRFDGNQSVHRSIEDEAVDVTENPTSTSFEQTWSFDNITNENGISGGGGHDGVGSPLASGAATDEAQHDSSGDERFMSPRNGYDPDTEMDIPGVSHYELGPPPDEDLPPSYEEPPPPPDYQSGITREDMGQIWDQKQTLVNVPAQGEDQRSEEAAEIHIDDEDDKN